MRRRTDAALLCVAALLVALGSVAPAAGQVNAPAAVLQGGVTADANCDEARPETATDGRAIVPCRYRTTIRSLEPSFGFLSDGTILVQGWALEDDGPGGFPPVPEVWRSTDGAQTWTDVSPLAEVTSLDPYLHVDPDTDRVFSVNYIGQAIGACSSVSISDDAGDLWITSPGACGGFDGQSIGTGPPAITPLAAYPNIVYFCTGSTLGTGSSTSPACFKSLDGGLTYLPITFPFDLQDQADESQFGAWAGTPLVNSEGRVFIPKRVRGEPGISFSDDEGLGWTVVQVADNGAAGAATRVQADENDVLYYTWAGGDRLTYLATSTDGGSTWSDPIAVAPASVTETALPRIAVRASGHLAIAYLGSETAPGTEPFFDFCNPLLADCIDGDYAGVPWHGYLTEITDLFGTPSTVTTTINAPSEPLFRGGCAPDGGCKANLDFIDIHYAMSGEPWAIYVDDCAIERTFAPLFSPDAGACEDGLGWATLGRITPARSPDTPVTPTPNPTPSAAPTDPGRIPATGGQSMFLLAAGLVVAALVLRRSPTT